jgi:hypothetical protein
VDELYEHYPVVIAAMRTPFTSHEFILALARTHQQAYIDALAPVRDTSDPFRCVHAQLATRLNRHPELVEQLPDVDSPDIFGEVVRCAS